MLTSFHDKWEDKTIFNRLRQFLGSQNFALTSTNVPEICILRNQVNDRGIFCVLIDNTRSRIFSSSQLLSISSQLTASEVSLNRCTPENLLFIVITGDSSRDRYLSTIGLNVWLADTSACTLLIYENQPTDFYGLRSGIENAISAGNPPKVSVRSIPYVTIILVSLNIIYYIILTLGGNVSSSSYMLSRGACFGPYVFQNFELWRLVSAMFIHFGVMHLISNMIYLGIAGYNLERAVGHWRFALIYVLSGIGGNLVSAAYYFIKGSYTVSGGASGAIYGLIGGIALLTFLSFRKLKPTYVFGRIIILLIFVFYSSFAATGVDGAAHIGGFFFGILLTFLFFIGGKKHEKR